jgi:NADPH:quinone reductase-like Zn-dependent oxidoreductase
MREPAAGTAFHPLAQQWAHRQFWPPAAEWSFVMKAVRLASPASVDSLRVTEIPEPGRPGSGEILVRVRASSLNYHDYAVVAGMIPAADGRIPLSDAAGEIAAIGEGVTELAVGDRVVSTFFPTWIDGRAPDTGFSAVPGDGMDGYAREFVIARATAFTPAPKSLSLAEAAAIPCAGVTAWRSLVVEGGVKAGDVVLTQGTGGVSTFALQIAKAHGATVIATSSSDAKLERLKRLGADHTINYRETPNWGAKARELSGGGVDHVVEIGGPGTLPESIEATRVGGAIYLIGVLTGFAGVVPTGALLMRQLRVFGIAVGSRRHQVDFIRAIDAAGIRPVVDRTFPLEAIAAAFRHQAAGAHFGKIALEI